MRHCFKCEFQKQAVVDTPGGPRMMAVCGHSECTDPVDGQPIPCVMARRELVFCGFNAKYYKEKEEVKKDTIIALDGGKIKES